MARIQKRATKSGATTYVVKWRTPDGTERSKGGFRTRKAANAMPRRWRTPKLRGMTSTPTRARCCSATRRRRGWRPATTSRRPPAPRTRDALAPADETTAKRHKPLADLRIDAVFGGYPLNKITREDISEWVARLRRRARGRRTVRNAYFLVRMVLEQAVEDGRLPANPAEYVKLPDRPQHRYRCGGRRPGAVPHRRTGFCTRRGDALAVQRHGARRRVVGSARGRTRRAAGRRRELPKPSLNPNAPAKPGVLRVQRTVARIGGELTYVPPKTKGSHRRVPLTAGDDGVVAGLPRGAPAPRDDPTPRCCPGMRLTRAPAHRSAGRRPPMAERPRRVAAAQPLRQATALAELTVETPRSGWCSTGPRRYGTRRSTRPSTDPRCCGPTGLRRPRSYRRSCRSTRSATRTRACASRRDRPDRHRGVHGPPNVKTTLTVYAHLINTDDHADTWRRSARWTWPMPTHGGNVIPMHG